MMKKCTKCKKIKSLDYFPLWKYSKDGFNQRCKDCHNKYRVQWAKNNPIKKKQSSEKWLLNNLDYRQKVTLKSLLKNKYNMTLDDFDLLNKNQKGRCYICGKNKNNERFKRLSVDHCHRTGKIRGLLCNNCNSILGLANDNIDILTNCIGYLIDNN